MLRIFLFGPLRYTVDGHPQRLHALPASLSLWSYLLLQRESAVPRDRLAYLLWPEASESNARANLRRHLHALRRALPPDPSDQPWLLIDNITLQWNPDAPYSLDIAEFEHATTEPFQPERLQAAVELYSGDLLEEMFDDWIFFERERLRNRHLESLRWLVHYHRDQQNFAQAIAYCRRLLQHEPMAEDVVRDLMQLRFDTGDRTGALQEYRLFRSRLHDEMDLSPMRETDALYDQIARQAATPNPIPAIPTRPLPSVPAQHIAPSNLPAPLTSFVGREQEMAALRAMLTSQSTRTRLVTLTGPGGCGKTRLAIEAGARLRDLDPPPFPAGVFFVPLVSVTDPALVISAIVDRLGISDIAGRTPLELLKDSLRGRRVLLILDNFEHVADAAPALGDLLSTLPDLMMLVTSRAALHLYGEQEMPIAPLALPDLENLPPLDQLSRYAAVSLFLTRSRAVNPTFALTSDNAAAIAEICTRLDGLPLAIELAAARSRLLDANTLRDRLEDWPTFLQNRARDPHERHQTLRATLEWSYDLLEPATRRIFEALSVFVGTFSLDAAEKICRDRGDVVAGLEALIDNSLLRPVEMDTDIISLSGTGPRYRMLALIRSYARALLDEQPGAQVVAHRHALYFLGIALESEQHLRSSGHLAWLQLLEWEHENMRAALRWTLSGDGERAVLGVELAALLGQFWFLAGYLTEGQRWIRQALEKAGDKAGASIRALAVYALGVLMQAEGDLRHVQPHFEQSLALYREANDPYGVADATYALGRLIGHRREYDQAEQLLQESLALAQSLNYIFRISYILQSLAALRLARHDLAGAEALLKQALDSARRIDDKSGECMTLGILGELARLQNDYSRAETLYHEAMALAELLHKKDRRVWLLHNMAYVVLNRGQPRRAAALFQESMRLGRELPNKENFGMCLLGLGTVAVIEDDLPRAVQLFGAALHILEDLGGNLAPADQIELDRYTAIAQERMDAATYRILFDQGRQLTPEAAEALALDKR